MTIIYAMYPEATRHEITSRLREAEDERRRRLARRHLPRTRGRSAWTTWR